MEQQKRLDELYFLLNNGYSSAYNPLETVMATINLAGLRALNFTQEEVIEIWVEGSTHPDFVMVREFLALGEWQMFYIELNKVFQENLESLVSQFPESELIRGDTAATIPLPILHEVIRIWESENPPQPRPVVETESEP